MRYDLTLAPDVEAMTFDGHADISVDVREATREVRLHGVDLDIARVTVTQGEASPRAEVSFDADAEEILVSLDEDLRPGPATLSFEYRGKISRGLEGMYVSTYEADGVTHRIVTTQLAATEARKVFPSWDEPDAKAVFSLRLVAPPDVLAVANTAEVEREVRDDGRVEIRFADTPLLPTYLVAFALGRLEATEPVMGDGVALRVIHVPGKGHLTGFALEMGAFALHWFTEYYGIPYPGDKLDMIALPDFGWGAMENFGAITFRENGLLVDPAHATEDEIARVAEVIAHEIAHMWFGDLVTMKWWNGVWLNEAFATFMELKCVDAFRPQWHRWLDFAVARDHSMDIDALETTRPVEFEVVTPEQALGMYDTITYTKGSAVLRMLEQFLGEDTFREGIRGYLRTHAFGNAETEDLWAALEAASAEPVAAIMDSWIFQGGYPRLTVTVTETGHRIEQRPFRFSGESEQRWKVPLLYGDGTEVHRAIVDDEAVLPIGDQLILNRGGHGFYRVHYDAQMLAGIAERLERLEPLERHAVVADTWANVLSGDSDPAGFLRLLPHLRGDGEPVVWSAVFNGLEELAHVADDAGLVALNVLVHDLLEPELDRLGWRHGPDDAPSTRKLRGMVIQHLGNLGEDPAVIGRARDIVEEVLAGGPGADPEVRAAAFAITGAHGDAALVERLLDGLATAPTPQMYVRMLRAASAVPVPAAIDHMIEAVIAGRVRSQDAAWVIAGLLGTRGGGDHAWGQVEANWDAIVSVLPPQNARNMLATIPYRSDPAIAAGIETWLRSHPIPAAATYLEQQLERLTVRVALRRRAARAAVGVTIS